MQACRSWTRRSRRLVAVFAGLTTAASLLQLSFTVTSGVRAAASATCSTLVSGLDFGSARATLRSRNGRKAPASVLRVADTDVPALPDVPIWEGEDVAELRRYMMRKTLAPDTPSIMEQQLIFLGDNLGWFLLAAIAITVPMTLWDMTHPKNDNIPNALMPTLEEWLSMYAPERPPPRLSSRPKPVQPVSLEPVTSVGELWEAYSFSTAQIVEETPSMVLEQNFMAATLLQLAAFPTVYEEWTQYEECLVDEVALGADDTSLAQVDSEDGRPPVPQGSLREVVLECGKMLDTYGLNIIARGEKTGELAGACAMVVKRLPEECHIDDGPGDEDASVVCTVDWDAVAGASALEAVGYLQSIAVARGFRGQGLAKRLLSLAVGKAKTWGLRMLALHVHRDNWSALRFYQKYGFEITSDWMGWGDGFFLLVAPITRELRMLEPEPARDVQMAE
eukprot:TRINITY_DN61582_c0_g1_i1.p1 TRINITY_DN61582_c0_g1~~TRINITY_DN61582_c0_g1_i1.p1  ORF type:complete len:449 (+),score=112.02 TRINITY_DN61582_c0_g1_i1:158-1504(+)